jgi:hypothetical protein
VVVRGLRLCACVGAAMLLGACSMEQVKHAAYDALYSKQCMDQKGYPDCDPHRPSYDQYKKARDQVISDKSQ